MMSDQPVPCAARARNADPIFIGGCAKAGLAKAAIVNAAADNFTDVNPFPMYTPTVSVAEFIGANRGQLKHGSTSLKDNH
jgi:hypothetical protein